MSENPYVDVGVIERIYQTVSKLEIELDDDPLTLGPGHLNNKFAEAQRIRMALSRLDLKVAGFLMRLKRRHNLANLEYDLKKKYLIANDPETRAGRNLSAMEAIAQGKLSDDWRDLFYMGEAVREFDDILKIVRARTRTIRDAQSQLKNQQRLCERQIDLGEFWGSRSLTGKKPLQLRHNPTSSDEVTDLILEVESHYDDSKNDSLPNPKIIDVDDEDVEVDDFLNTVDVESMSAVPKPEPVEEEIDIDALIGG